MVHLGKLVRVRRVNVVEDQVVQIEFEDGSVRQLDLSPLMHGPIFDEILENQALFRKITVAGGTLAWPNGADIDPDVLYYGLTPASVSEIDTAR
jgi:hypothetical protein